MRLHGAVTEPHASVKEQRARWLMDRKEVAEGLDVFVAAPRAGRHTLELTVGSGRTGAKTRIGFVTIDLEREARKHEGRED